MTVAVLCLIWVLWPVFAFAGGLAFAPLAGLAGLLLLPLAVRGFRFRIYMIAIGAFLAFAAASVMWSPRPFALIEMDFAAGDFHMRSEVLRVGLLFVALASVAAAAGRLSGKGASAVQQAAVGAMLVQLVVCALLAVFENQALALFAPMMANAGEGVQNITRNNQIMAMAAPLLIAGLAGSRPSGAVIGTVLTVVAAEAAIFLWRGVDAGLLALVFAGAAAATAALLPRHGFRVIGFGMAAVILAAPFALNPLVHGADAAVADSSITYRMAIWDRTIEEMWLSPWIGGGVGVLRTIAETIPSGVFGGDPVIPNHAHSMPLQLWAELGAVGAGLLSLAIVLAAWRLPAPSTLGRAGLAGAGFAGAAFAVACVSYDLWNEWWWAAGGFLVATLVAIRITATHAAAKAAEGESEMPVAAAPSGPVHRSNNFHLIRLLLALAVAVYHFDMLPGLGIAPHIPFLAPYATPLELGAELAVQGFFVISGYLVYDSLLRSDSLADYASKRVRRLYPAYASIVLVCAAAALIVSPEARDDLAGVARYAGWNLAFLNFMEPELPGLFQGNTFTEVNGALWTLKIEVMFYLFLPLLGWLLHVAGKARWWILGGLYAAGEVWRLGWPAWGQAMFPDAVDWTLSVILSRQFPGQLGFFVTGIGLCLLRDHINWRSALPVVGMAMLVASLVWVPAHALRPLALGVFVVWLAAGIPPLFNAARFGDLSYGVYIVNSPIIQAFAAAGLFTLSPWGAGAAATVAVFLAAFLMWHLIERPFLRRDSAYRGGGRKAAVEQGAPAQQPA